MLPFVFLPAYAEIHYRFRYFFSLLTKHEPEIIADVPYRLELPQTLPVLLLVKDAHRYPVTLHKADVFIDGQKAFSKEFNEVIERHFFETILEVPTEAQSPGNRQIVVKCVYSIKGKTKTCINDNYRGTSKTPLPCRFTNSPLPLATGFVYGDLHSHSSFTEDQIEFGAGIAVMQRMARAIGLHFFAVTDHSYDLDDLPDNYLKNDPELRKWKTFWQMVSGLNANPGQPVIIPGEELSVGNHKSQNAHLLLLNNPRFIYGRGDSGERWFRFKPDHRLEEVPQFISEQALAIPAHSAEKVPLLQKWLINRGEWNAPDLRHAFIFGLQGINGGNEAEISAGIQQWVRQLLEGRRLTLMAGNDAHGNFARTRQIGIPFVSIQETDRHRFGVWKTGVFLGKSAENPQEILNALRLGNVFVTNGPFVDFNVIANEGVIPVGGTTNNIKVVHCTVRSSKEFGTITQVQLLAGDLKEQKERIVWQESFEPNQTFNVQEKITLRLSPQIGYIRCQAITQTGNQSFKGLTNAIYVHRSS